MKVLKKYPIAYQRTKPVNINIQFKTMFVLKNRNETFERRKKNDYFTNL